MKYYIEQRADLRPTLEQIQWSERRYLSPRAAEILRAEQLPVVKRGGRGGRPLVLPKCSVESERGRYWLLAFVTEHRQDSGIRRAQLSSFLV